MSESYFLTVKSVTPSRLWVNNPTLAEIELAQAQGAIGCTTNPSYAGNLLRRAPEEVLPVIRACMSESPDATAAAHLVQARLVARIAARFRPIFDASARVDGYVSIQGAPDEDNDGERILAQGLRARALGPNIAVKIPATEPGLYAFERLVAEGTPTIVTEVFSLAQLVEANETYLRVVRQSRPKPRFFMSPITGIFGDHLKVVAKRDAISCSSDVIGWAGVAFARACNHVVESKRYPVTLLYGGARLAIDFTGLVGSPTASTINYGTVEEILSNPPVVEDTIHKPVDPQILSELRDKFTDFAAAMEPDALTKAEFEHFGPVLHFRDSFISGWKSVVQACAAESRSQLRA